MISHPSFQRAAGAEAPQTPQADRADVARRSVMRASVAAALGRLATTGGTAREGLDSPPETNPRD
jgi:hypothetical protein